MEQMKHGMTADLVFENMSKELKTLRPPCDNSVTPCRDMPEFPNLNKGNNKKKKREKAVRLTAWVDPPSPEAVKKM